MLELQNVVWSLPDGEKIINGITMHADAGKLTVVTGPNGGGKTSIAKLTAGLYTPTEGKIFLDGQDVTGLDITQRAKLGITYAFQQPVHFKGLKVRDLLEISAEDTLDEPKICGYLSKVGLCARDYIDRAVDASLSGGEIKRIEIAIALARKNARLLVFDEPEAGIDLWSFTSLIEVFRALREERNRALLVISHQERILEIADELVVIASGRVRTSGPRDEVLPTLLDGEKQSACPIHPEDAKVSC